MGKTYHQKMLNVNVLPWAPHF